MTRLASRLLKALPAAIVAVSMLIAGATPAAAGAPPTSISLWSSATEVSAGQSFEMTATVDRPLEESGSILEVYKVGQGVPVYLCTEGKTCRYTDMLFSGPPAQYEARVGSLVSDRVTVSRKPWYISLEAQSPTFRAGHQARLSAATQQPVGLTGGAYAMHIVDLTTNEVVKTCADETVHTPHPWAGVYAVSAYRCSTDQTFYTGGPHQYQAVIAAADDHTRDVQATSEVVSVEREPWYIYLGAQSPTFGAGYQMQLAAVTRQPVGLTGGNYAMHIVDLTMNEVIKTCADETVQTQHPWGGFYSERAYHCSLEQAFYTGGPHQYQAVIAAAGDHTQDVQAASEVVTVGRKGWTIALDSSLSAAAAPGTQMVLNATANQPVGLTNGAYAMYIIDSTVGEVVKKCDTIEQPLGHPWLGYWARSDYYCYVDASVGQSPHAFKAVVANANDHTQDVQAEADFVPRVSGGPTLPFEMAGGCNPSQPKTQRCVGDPINTATGELWLDETDLSVPALGVDLDWGRTFSTQRRAESGDLGHGWSHPYALRIESTGPAIDATELTVVQENGSAVRFSSAGDDVHYLAPLRTTSTLERTAEGFRFTRDDGTSYLFDGSGRLSRVEDLNHAGVTLGYGPAGTLLSVQHDDGRALAIARDANGYIESVTDPAGRVVQYDVSASGELLSVGSPERGEWTYGYDTAHRIATITNPLSGVTTNSYDSLSRVIEQTDPLGGVLTLSYAPGYDTEVTTITHPDGEVSLEHYRDGVLASVVEASGTPLERVKFYGHDEANRLAWMAEGLGSSSTYFEYDDQGNVTKVTDPLGRVTTNTYGQFGRLLTSTDPAGGTTTLTYDDRWNLTSSTGPDGSTTTLSLNADGTIASATDPLGGVTSYQYDAAGLPVSVTDPTGAQHRVNRDAIGRVVATVTARGTQSGATAADFTTAIALDAAGRQTAIIQPSGATSTTAYDPAGNPTALTDEVGAVTSATYDKAGRMLTRTDPEGGVTRWTYDAEGRVASVTDPDDVSVTMTYDVLGRLVETADAEGRTTTMTYDAADRMVSRTTPGGAVTRWTYDEVGQVTKVVDPSGKTTTMSYDLAGRRTSTTDPLGRTILTTYDAAGRVLEVELPDGSSQSWSYDAAGRTTSYTDGAGATTTYAYDAAGRLTAVTDTAGRNTTHEYDPDGNLIRTVHPDGGVVARSYDAANRQTAVDYSDTTPDETYTYDAAGHLTAATAGAVTTSTSYDLNGAAATVTTDGLTVGYERTAGGRLERLTYPGGQEVGYDYTAAGFLSKVKDWTGGSYVYGWDLDGQNTSLAYPNGIVTQREHDVAGRMSALSSATDTEDILSVDYAYDAAGQVTSIGSSRPSGARAPLAEPDTSTGYAWDQRGRLAQATGTYGGDFGFTANGQVSVLPDGRELTYDAANQVVSSAPAPGLPTTFTYDARGNRTSQTTGTSVRTYDFDLANRLRSVASASSSVTYGYEASGLRSSSTTLAGTERFVWDSATDIPKLLADGDHLFIYGAGTVPLAQVDKSTGGVLYLHTDVIGSVRTVTDEDGAVVADSDYTAYGQPVDLGATEVGDVTPFGFAGEYTDATGLVYLRARFYDPATAQFISRDPIELVTLDPYGYAAGNPLLLIDPLGLWGWNPLKWTRDEWGVVGKVAGGVALAATLATLTVATGGTPFLVVSTIGSIANGASLLSGGMSAAHACGWDGDVDATDCAVEVVLGAAIPAVSFGVVRNLNPIIRAERAGEMVHAEQLFRNRVYTGVTASVEYAMGWVC